MTEALPVPDSLAAWIAHYQHHAVAGPRSPAAAAKIALHLGRFQTYFVTTYGHDRLSVCVRRDVLGWQAHLRAIPLAPATVNSHLASLTAFTAWVTTQAPTLFAAGNPGTHIGELGQDVAPRVWKEASRHRRAAVLYSEPATQAHDPTGRILLEVTHAAR